MGIVRKRSTSRRRVKKSYRKNGGTSTVTTIKKRTIARKRRGRKRKGPRLVMYNRLLQHKVRTALVYADTKTLGSSSGQTHHTFSLNSIADPDIDGVGHQPAFHDKWATLYTNYRVIKTTFHIRFMPNRGPIATTFNPAVTAVDTSHNDQLNLPGIVGYEINDQNAVQQFEPGDKNIIREVGWKKNCKFKLTTPNPNSTYSFSGTAYPKSYLDDPDKADTAVLFGANPASNARGHLHVCKLSKDGGGMASYRFDIRITYYVELTDPIGVENEN